MSKPVPLIPDKAGSTPTPRKQQRSRQAPLSAAPAAGLEVEAVEPACESTPHQPPATGLLQRCPSPVAPHGRALLEQLIDCVDWQRHYQAYGRNFDLPRVQAWYADAGVQYRHANNLLVRKDWTEPLWALRQAVEASCGAVFNAVLLTWYRDGSDHVTWHADDEPELGDAPVIASLSLGSTRTFEYRRKSGGEVYGVPLHDGELWLMQPDFQHHWVHRVPPEPAVQGDRINLTFRRAIALTAQEQAAASRT